jgi:hypothetical protein
MKADNSLPVEPADLHNAVQQVAWFLCDRFDIGISFAEIVAKEILAIFPRTIHEVRPITS